MPIGSRGTLNDAEERAVAIEVSCRSQTPSTIGTVMGWFKEFRLEWRARRDGRKHLDNNIRRATREIAGPTGWVVSRTWDAVDKGGDAYVKSFDPRLPPSTFVSERDRRRANMPMPLAERCIEDWGTDNVYADPSEILEPTPKLEQQ